MMTSKSIDMPDIIVKKYIHSLIGQFYKILPIKESGEPSIRKYIDSLQREILGFNDLFSNIHNDESIVSLLAILEYLNNHDCDVSIVKAEVFKAIAICKKLQQRYFAEEV